jgi:hypothetical protein
MGRGDGVGQRGLRQQIGRGLTHATELSLLAGIFAARV